MFLKILWNSLKIVRIKELAGMYFQMLWENKILFRSYHLDYRLSDSFQRERDLAGLKFYSYLIRKKTINTILRFDVKKLEIHKGF